MIVSKPGAGWCDAGNLPEVLTGEPLAILVAETDLVLVRTSAGLKIFESRCPHQGALLSEGEVKDDLLICRNHRWTFDCESGKRVVEGKAVTRTCLKSYPFKVHDGKLWIDLDDDQAGPRLAKGTLRRPEELPGPKGLPLLGNARQLDVGRLHLILEDWAREYGTMYTFRIGRQRLIVVSDPSLISEVLRERPETFRRARKLEPVFDEMGVSGVFSAEGQAWRPQRKLAMNALAQRNLKGFFPVLYTVAERLRQRWARLADTGEIVDMQAELMRFTVDVTTMLAFGRDVNTLEQGDDVIQRHMEPIFPIIADRLQAIIPYWRFMRLPRDRNVDSSIAAVKAWLSPIVAATRERLEKHPELLETPSNFLESMLASTDENGEPFAEERIFGNAMTMLLAGEDTTANTLAWAVHHLLDDAAVVERLVEEADATLGSSGVPESIEIAQSLRFAAAVANETMRLRPVAPLLFIDANHETTLGDVRIDPSNTLVLLFRPPAVDPDLMAQSDAFMPARWLEADTHQATQQRQAHMPFGSGPRICPGRSLAILEMNVVLATLYKNFTVHRVGDSAAVREKFSFTMHPVGLRVRLKPR